MKSGAGKQKFLWGVSCSPYQHEGGYNGEGQPRNNWYDWEVAGKVELSGRSVDFWNRYEEDFDRAEMMGLSGYRLGIEWARLQPEQANKEFSDEVLARYIDMIAALRARDLEPLVTLSHFTTPRWLGRDPWLSEETPELFSSYACRMLEQLNRK
ncbi:MAG: glycoside hydrolase family 1 protein, partial [Verrucomicrobia bacterium]|nr:glycoside hydrolase family 1 protein [Verrucomicrobiota bacterium]